jgi:large subunit ribosomal protein L25
MADVELTASPRTVLGKKAKRLRHAGLVPANIYGRGVASTAIEAPMLEIRRVIRAAGHTTLVRISIDGDSAPRTAIIREIQREFTTGNIVHVDFQQVSMTEKMRVHVPVALTGDAPVVEEGGVVVKVLDNIEIECLPGDIPQHLEADISALVATDSKILVRDLRVPSSVTVLTDGELPVASVTLASTEEEGVVAAEEEAEAEAEEEAEAAAEPAAESDGEGKAAASEE